MTKSCQTEEQAEAGVVRKGARREELKPFMVQQKKLGVFFFPRF